MENDISSLRLLAVTEITRVTHSDWKERHEGGQGRSVGKVGPRERKQPGTGNGAGNCRDAENTQGASAQPTPGTCIFPFIPIYHACCGSGGTAKNVVFVFSVF